MAKRCSSGCRYEEIHRDRRRPGTHEFSRRFSKYEETRRIRKLRNRTQWQSLGISTHQQITCCTWRMFSRSWDKDTVSAQWTKWRTSMWTQLYGVYLCLSLFRLQFILVKTTQKICDLPRINPRNLWDTYFKWPRGWSLTRPKLLDWQRLIGSSLCGERRLCWLTKLLSLQLPKPKSFLSQCYVWEVSVLNQSKHGTAGLIGFWKHVISKIWIGSTGSRWSSSGKSSQDSQHWEFSTRFKRWWENYSVNQRTSMYNDIDWGKRGNKEDCIANALRVTEYGRRFTRGHWSFLGLGSEKKWYGTHDNKADEEWVKTAEDMMLNFAESGHLPCFQRVRKKRLEKQWESSKIHSLEG